MAASSLLALIDDIGTILDDVALLTKLATKKTAGVLGDDLALNAQQLTGVRAQRELPVVWAVMRGSFVNKSILVPAALAISAFVPWAVTPLLMLGGAYLCFEGCEKLAHRWLHSNADHREQRAKRVQALADPAVDLVQLEKDKIKGAVRTDFILSAEIIAITLGTVAAAALLTQIFVLTAIAVTMTVGVYGFVAAVVKLDDAGLYLCAAEGASTGARARRILGEAILGFAPWLMKALSVAGTAAMFLVGGGILVHGIGPLHHAIAELGDRVAAMPGVGSALSVMIEAVLRISVGIFTGAVALAAVSAFQRLRPPSRAA